MSAYLQMQRIHQKALAIGHHTQHHSLHKPHSTLKHVVYPTTRLPKRTRKLINAQSTAARTTNSTQSGAAIDTFKVAIFSAQEYVKDFMGPVSETFPNTTFIDDRLSMQSAHKAEGFDAVCLFVNDTANAEVIDILAEKGVKFIAMRCAGFDRVDLEAAAKKGIKIARVPTYSPASVAEFALALLMTLSKKLQLAIPRCKDGNYTVSGLQGWELASRNFGIIGTGAIGAVMAKLVLGFQTHTGQKPTVYAYDLFPRQDLIDMGVEYVELDTLLRNSDVVSLHCPLLPTTFHLISEEKIKIMKDNALLINVSRGGLINTEALLEALYDGKFMGVGMDVYEREGNLFFKDYTRYDTADRLKAWDREFAALKSLPNVVITPHVAFMTDAALREIQQVTTANLAAMALGEELKNEVKYTPK